MTQAYHQLPPNPPTDEAGNPVLCRFHGVPHRWTQDFNAYGHPVVTTHCPECVSSPDVSGKHEPPGGMAVPARRALAAWTVKTVTEQTGVPMWETLLQKTLFFAQDMLRVPTGYTFVLARLGPHSDDLNDDLAAMAANFTLEEKPGTGGEPAFTPGLHAE